MRVHVQKLSDGAWQRVTEIAKQPERARYEAGDGRIQLEASRQQVDLLARARTFPEGFRPSPMMTGPTLMKAVIAYIDHLEAELSTARSLLDQQDEVEVTSVRDLIENSADTTKDGVLVELSDRPGEIYVAARLSPGRGLTVDSLGNVNIAQIVKADLPRLTEGLEIKVEPAPRGPAYGAPFSQFVELGTVHFGPMRYDDAAAAELEREELLKAFVGPDDARRILRIEPRPVIYGTVKNVEPPVKGHSGETFSFEQALRDVYAVYDDGVPLKRGQDFPFALAAGEYRVRLHRGDIILGSKPKGRVTADVTGFEDEAERGLVRLYGRGLPMKVSTVEEMTERFLERARQMKYELVPMGETGGAIIFQGARLKAHPGTVVVVGGERGFGKTEKLEAELTRAKAGGATVVRLGGPKVHKPWPGALTGELMSSRDVAALSDPDEA